MPAKVPDSEVKHGEYAGAQWHKRNKVPACEPCKKANRDYMRELGKRQRVIKAKAKAREEVRLRAHRRLAAKYPHEYTEFLKQEEERYIQQIRDGAGKQRR